MNRWMQCLRLLVCLAGFFWVWATPLSAQTMGLNASRAVEWEVEYIPETAGGVLTIDDVRSPAHDSRFQPLLTDRENINLGFSQHGQWLRVLLDYSGTSPMVWVLELAYMAPDWLDLYLPDGSQVLAGSARKRAAEQLDHQFFAVPMQLLPGRNVLYMHVQSDSALTLPLRVIAPFDFLKHVQGITVLQALYFGALAAMTAYNLFLAISLRDRRFGLYVLFALMLGAGMFSGNGYGRLYLWPEAVQFDRVAQMCFLSLAAAFSVAFSRAFLQLERNRRRTARALRAAEVLMFGCALYFMASALFSWPLQHVYWLLMVVAVPAAVLILLTGIRSLPMGGGGTRFFILAWATLWLGVFVATLRMLDCLPSTPVTLYALQISSVFEMLLLAFALADIVRHERAQRDQLKATALQTEQSLVMQLQASEQRLEQTVHARTVELQEALAKQQLLLNQYVRFGALISHEFRNPLGIIQSQISLLRRLSVAADTEASRRLDIIAGSVRRLLQLFERWLQGGRLQHLEKDLHIEPVRLDLWLEDLLQAHPQYRHGHRVLLCVPPDSAAGAAWQVMADDSLLEIAVLNLLDNACKYTEQGTEIRIELRSGEGHAGIAIVDQGPGISREQQERVFEDYVRLQPEGPVHGMGLGLAFVKRIAALLEGFVELHSLPGHGSTFCLWLPSRDLSNRQ